MRYYLVETALRHEKNVAVVTPDGRLIEFSGPRNESPASFLLETVGEIIRGVKYTCSLEVVDLDTLIVKTIICVDISFYIPDVTFEVTNVIINAQSE